MLTPSNQPDRRKQPTAWADWLANRVLREVEGAINKELMEGVSWARSSGNTYKGMLKRKQLELVVKGSDILTRVEKSIEIRAPPEKVWEMLALDRQVEWGDGWKRVHYTSEVRTSEDKYRVGASAHIIEEHVELDFEIMESLENEKITYRFEGRIGRGIVTYALKPLEEGTKLTYAMDYEMPWGILGKIIDKLSGKRYMEKDMERSLENLKSILEK